MPGGDNARTTGEEVPMFGMRRRDFITLLGGAAAWQLAARAQQIGNIRRIGYLGPSSQSLERHLVGAFRQKLRELGHVEGENIAIEYRWAEGQDERLTGLAAELARLQPDVIVTTGTPGTLAAKATTSTIPIVFASSGNPVSAGLVASSARPGGNVTRFAISAGLELEGKRLEILHEVVPGLSRIALLWNSANPALTEFYQETQAAAAAMGLALQPVDVQRADDLKNAFTTIASGQAHAMIVLADRLLLALRIAIVNFATNSRVPVMYPYRGYVEDGGLMSYAPSDIEQFHLTAVYVDRILKGAKPADLPVQQPTKFDLVINLKTAKAIGVTIPETLLLRADEVIKMPRVPRAVLLGLKSSIFGWPTGPVAVPTR
jgi:putative tryptophan/tyrosine transport system substrate-binding protein